MRWSYKSLATLLSFVLVGLYISSIRDVCLGLLKGPGSARGRGCLGTVLGITEACSGNSLFYRKRN